MVTASVFARCAYEPAQNLTAILPLALRQPFESSRAQTHKWRPAGKTGKAPVWFPPRDQVMGRPLLIRRKCVGCKVHKLRKCFSPNAWHKTHACLPCAANALKKSQRLLKHLTGAFKSAGGHARQYKVAGRSGTLPRRQPRDIIVVKITHHVLAGVHFRRGSRLSSLRFCFLRLRKMHLRRDTLVVFVAANWASVVARSRGLYGHCRDWPKRGILGIGYEPTQMPVWHYNVHRRYRHRQDANVYKLRKGIALNGRMPRASDVILRSARHPHRGTIITGKIARARGLTPDRVRRIHAAKDMAGTAILFRRFSFPGFFTRTYLKHGPSRFAQAVQRKTRAQLPWALKATSYRAAAWALAKRTWSQ